MSEKLNQACSVCLNYKKNGGGCPGDWKASFYYPTDCDSYDDGEQHGVFDDLYNELEGERIY